MRTSLFKTSIVYQDLDKEEKVVSFLHAKLFIQVCFGTCLIYARKSIAKGFIVNPSTG